MQIENEYSERIFSKNGFIPEIFRFSTISISRELANIWQMFKWFCVKPDE